MLTSLKKTYTCFKCWAPQMLLTVLLSHCGKESLNRETEF